MEGKTSKVLLHTRIPATSVYTLSRFATWGKGWQKDASYFPVKLLVFSSHIEISVFLSLLGQRTHLPSFTFDMRETKQWHIPLLSKPVPMLNSSYWIQTFRTMAVRLKLSRTHFYVPVWIKRCDMMQQKYNKVNCIIIVICQGNISLLKTIPCTANPKHLFAS